MQATQEVIGRLPETTEAEFNEAVAAASQAFALWRRTPVSTRARVMFKLQQLIRENMVRGQACAPPDRCPGPSRAAVQDMLAQNVSLEQGKTLPDARGDVFRGLEVVEYATGIASEIRGEYVEHVSTGMDTYSIRQPLGVRHVLQPDVQPACARQAPI